MMLTSSINSQRGRFGGEMTSEKFCNVICCGGECYDDFLMAVKLGTELVTTKAYANRKSLLYKEL